MNRWTCLLLYAALSTSGKLRAQTCTVNGTVLDPSGAAVVGADVQLQAARKSTLPPAPMVLSLPLLRYRTLPGNRPR